MCMQETCVCWLAKGSIYDARSPRFISVSSHYSRQRSISNKMANDIFQFSPAPTKRTKEER